MAAYCIGIYFVVFIFRYIAEARSPSLCVNPSWSKLLRVLPPLLGGIVAVFMTKYPFLDTLPTAGTRFIYGTFGGGVASFLYLIFKAVINKWFGVKVDDDEERLIVTQKTTQTETAVQVIPAKKPESTSGPEGS